ncbi:MAG: hypothetical protein FJY83_06135 [Candidatus Aminicenantes bacterium]|nr:hypothetical protein [Candidatus Aminicenantes bacterium]
MTFFVVVTLFLVLVGVGILVWRELAVTNPEQGASVAPDASGKGPTYLTPEEWEKRLKEKYAKLKSLLNEKRWDDVGELYGEKALVEDKITGKKFPAKREIAYDFWKNRMEGKANKTVVDFEIRDLVIYPANIPTSHQGYPLKINQIVFYKGKLKTQASPTAESEFEGIAGHIESCPDIILCEIHN